MQSSAKMYADVLPSMLRKRPYFLKATLKKQEAVFTDNSGTVRLVLWESDIARVISKSVYNMSKIVVREFSIFYNAKKNVLSVKEKDN